MIARKDGLWWPEEDHAARPVILEAVTADVPKFLAFVEGRSTIVQAGGNVGVYAIALARQFASVVTVEPDQDNYAALCRNVEASGLDGRILHLNAAFGEEPGFCAVDRMDPANCGAHRLMDGDQVQVITVDSLGLNACDAIWLDVEGFELPALKGAEATIDRFGPTIGIEEKGLSEHFGVRRGQAAEWLKTLGYGQVGKIGRDEIYRRGEP
jgi:FkbM family methyltransferase